MPILPQLLLVVTLALPLLATSVDAAPAGDNGDKNNQVGQGASAEFVYKYLIGEIAGQRGDFGLSAELFMDLAKSTRDSRLAERATRASVNANQGQLALRAGALWVELDPDSMEAHQVMMQLLVSNGKLNDAKPHLQKLLAREEGRANGFLYLNGLLSRHDDNVAVLKLVQDLAKPYPTLPEAHFAVAHAAWNATRSDLALVELRLADQYRPGWEMAALLQGQVLQKKSVNAAVDFYQEFLNKYPQANDVRLNYAKLLVNDKRFDAAREQFIKLTELSSGNPEVYVVVGLLSFQQNDYALAEKFLTEALNQDFKDKEQIYLLLGQIAEKQQHDDQALEWYKRVEAGNHYFETQLHISAMLARQHQLDKARELLHSLSDLSSEQQVIAIQTEANLLALAKNNNEAFDLLGKAVANQPNSNELIYDYAMAAERVSRYDIMEHELRKLIHINPDFAQAYNALGYLLADRSERLDEAGKLIEKALALSPDDHFILDSMGWVQYRLGHLDKAEVYLQRAYAMQTDPEIAAHLGEVLWQQGKHDEAIKAWDDALKDHPDNEVLLNTTKKFKQ